MSERILCNDNGGELREEIVRCRDCVYFDTDKLGEFCSLFNAQLPKQVEGFCAWGEREPWKDVDDEHGEDHSR